MTARPTTNAEVLTAIFDPPGQSPTLQAARPWVCAFDGDPKHGNWAGRAWTANESFDTPSLNAYFTLASFRQTGDGSGKRTADNCAAIYGVMLDDVGTKGRPLAELSAQLPPSVVIETSPGNHQALYLFDAPATDMPRVAALIEGLARAGWSDPGAKSPATRYGRLPFAINGKHTPPFPCQLNQWAPWIRYPIEVIAQGLSLDVAPACLPPVPGPPSSAWEAMPAEEQARVADELSEALTYIPADERSVWVKVGHFLKASLPGDLARALWAEWSQTSDKFQEGDLDHFDTFKPTQGNHRAVFALAADYGWRNPRAIKRDYSAVGFGVGVTLPADATLVPPAPANATTFKRVPLDDIERANLPAQRWIWDRYIPAGEVTLLTGHGGQGKSTIAAMVGACVATGLPAFGVPTERARVLYFSAEDTGDTLRRSFRRVCRHLGIAPEVLDSCLTVLDATEDDPTLAGDDGAPTAAYSALASWVAKGNYGLVIVDNSSDVYGGNEIDRRAVRRFMQSLARLVRAHGGAVLLLAHVDKGTSRRQHATADEGYSGSTAWHNSARSRLFLSSSEKGLLELKHQKSNRGPMRDPLLLSWLPDSLPVPVQTPHSSDEDDTEALLGAIGAATQAGERIAPNRVSPFAAHKVLRKYAEFPAHLADASKISELLDAAAQAGKLKRATRKGPGRNTYEVWELAA